MRVLIVSFGIVPEPARQGVVFDNLLKALAPRYEVDALTIREAEMPYVQRYRGARMLRVPVDGSHEERVSAFQRAVRRQIEGSDYDVIHVRDAAGALPVCEMKAYHGARVVFEVQAEQNLPDGGAADGSRRSDLAPRQLACLERSDLALVRGREAAEIIQKVLPEVRVAQFPPAVDIDAFDWEPVFRRDGADPSERRIVYVGNVAEGVGLEDLIDAMPIVLESEPARLVIAGPPRGASWPRLSARARALGLESRLELCQAIDHSDVARFLAGAAVAVVPHVAGGDLGGCPSKLLEYAACRLPIVAPRAAAVRSL
ncbi:MAG: glycosyltransferase family 4 protein, partial [Myxococcales bacterium]|nr:glycosyltransferase family 4 protein [Myxococcales bacterium]